MNRMLLYGVGSPLVADVEESLARSGVTLEAGILNCPGESYLLDSSRLIELKDMKSELLQFPYLIPLFTPAYRWKASQEAHKHGLSKAGHLIDSSVLRPRTIEYQPGLFVNAGCILGAAIALGRFVMINRGANIGHHVELGPFVSIGPGAVLGGMVRVGRGSVLGAGAVILPEVSIGANSIVAAGSVVTKDVPDNSLVFGNPARLIRKSVPGYRNEGIP